MELEKFLNQISGTLLEEIIQKEDYFDLEIVIKRQESFIEHMNDIEKSIFSLICEKTIKLEGLLEKLQIYSSGELSKLEIEILKLIEEIDLSETFFWYLIKKRLNNYKDVLRIRKNFKIVLINDEKVKNENTIFHRQIINAIRDEDPEDLPEYNIHNN